jgi:transcriptional regulator with XRE-family HTH domain
MQPGLFLPPILREAYARPAAKRIAIDAGCSVETARNWLRGRCEPGLSFIDRMAARNIRLRAALIQELSRHDAAAARAGAAGTPRAAQGGMVGAAGDMGGPAAGEVTR